MLTHIDDMGVEQDDWTGVWQWHVRDKVPARRFDITFSFRDYSAQFTTRRYGSHVTRSATNDSDEILDMVRSTQFNAYCSKQHHYHVYYFLCMTALSLARERRFVSQK